MTIIEELRQQHRKAIVEGKTVRAAWIREEIREEAKRLFKQGKTLDEIM